METKTRRDAMECQTRGHIRPPLGAVTDGEDAMVKLRFARCCNRTCLVPLETRLVRALLQSHLHCKIAKKTGQLR